MTYLDGFRFAVGFVAGIGVVCIGTGIALAFLWIFAAVLRAMIPGK